LAGAAALRRAWSGHELHDANAARIVEPPYSSGI
jgi:hypothetical protein